MSGRTKSSGIAPCSFFQRGKCTRGDQCRFAHVLQERPSDVSASDHCRRTVLKPSCRFHSRGNCLEGSHCGFSHCTSVSPEVLAGQVMLEAECGICLDTISETTGGQFAIMAS